VVCSGSDFETLYPATFATSGLTRCKLQMLRTVAQPAGWRIGPMLLTGFSLRHYEAYELCPSLPALREHVAAQHPELDRWGIHLLASQNGEGQVVLGDTHEYGLAPSPFNREEVDDLLLRYLRQVFTLPDFQIAARWHGIYAKHPTRSAFTASPAPNVQIVTGLGGIGMTTSFGLAQEVLRP
jgi:FAD dependent oxidoreductase TIGR03364